MSPHDLVTAAEISLRTLAYSTAAFTLLFYLGSVLAARRFARGTEAVPTPAPRPFAPPVAILKPIKGVDHEMSQNLVSFLLQDYPCFQVLFALQDPEDPALTLLTDLQQSFPSVDVQIVISRNRIGHNPKVSNLLNAYPFVKYDLLVVSDSDIRVERDFLRKAVAPFADPRVGMVTCFYRYSRARSLGGMMEGLSVNAYFLPQALVAGYLLGLRFAMGAVTVLRRSVLEAVGGFSSIRDHLADDYRLGALVLSAGYRLVFSDLLVTSVPGIHSIREHLAHLARWARTNRLCQPLGYAGLILLQGFAFLALHLLLFGPTVPTVALLLAVAFVRMVTSAWIHRVYLGTPDILPQLLLLPLSDLIQFGSWIAGFWTRSVRWRGESYHVTPEGHLVSRNRNASNTFTPDSY